VPLASARRGAPPAGSPGGRRGPDAFPRRKDTAVHVAFTQRKAGCHARRRRSRPAVGRPSPTAPRNHQEPRHDMTLTEPTRAVAAPALSALESAIAQFDRAAEHIGLAPETRAILRVPKREWTVNFPVTMDDGRTEVLTGYRVQHNM